MSSNDYRPIAKQMSELGVPIAAELICYTLLPGTSGAQAGSIRLAGYQPTSHE